MESIQEAALAIGVLYERDALDGKEISRLQTGKERGETTEITLGGINVGIQRRWSTYDDMGINEWYITRRHAIAIDSVLQHRLTELDCSNFHLNPNTVREIPDTKYLPPYGYQAPLEP